MSRTATAAAAPAATPATTPAPAAAPAPAAPTRWALDVSHTEVGFRVRHMMVSWTKGEFQRFSGRVAYDEARPEQTRVDVTIEAASLHSRDEKRDAHLRSADFFDVEKHPTLAFRSTGATRAGADGLDVEGELTIRGTTRPVVLAVRGIGPAVKDPWGGVRRGATASTRVSRKDFGLTWNAALELGGVAVGDEVLIELNIELLAEA
jgi:polyisoprenoid-binding protein YceI